jgi:phosphotriesterase-related protein
MRAVAWAHGRTGVPITVHTHPGTQQGLTVEKVLAEEGVDLRRVVLGHSGDTADAGFVLGMDRFGINLETTFEARADTVIEMCRRGYAASMVLSQDASCYIDWVDPGVMAMLTQWRYTHIHEEVLPYLREHGVTDEQIETMLVANPRRYFENTGTY